MAKPYKLTTIELDVSSKSTLTMILIILLTMRQLATTKKKFLQNILRRVDPTLKGHKKRMLFISLDL